MSTVKTVSEDFYNRSQSWNFDGVYRNSGGCYRVAIRTSNREEQASAVIEVWGVGGWNFHASVPTNLWFGSAPSYVKRSLEAKDRAVFLSVRDMLLERLAGALWGTSTVEVTK